MSVKIAAQFTGEARAMNGLDNIVDELNDDPKTPRLLIAGYHALRTTIEHDEGDIHVPTVKFDQVEPVLDPEDERTVRAILERAYSARMKGAAAVGGQPDLFAEADDPAEPDDPPTAVKGGVVGAGSLEEPVEAPRKPGSRAARKHLFSEDPK